MHGKQSFHPLVAIRLAALCVARQYMSNLHRSYIYAMNFNQAINRIKSQLPSDVDPQVISGSFSDFPVMQIAVSSDLNTLELADLILDKAEVAAVPGEAFGPSGYLRFSYALGDGPLLEGIQRLQKLFGTK